VLNTLRREREQHRESLSLPILAPLSAKAAQANIAFSPPALVMVMVFLGVMSFIMLTFFTAATLPIRLGVSTVMGYGAVFIWLSNKAKKRIALFEEQLPDAVELIVRSLRVGHPFSSSINIVAQEMPDPLGSEFGMIADEATYGMDINESLAKMAERVNVQDLMFLTVAVNIQSTSGGNLAEILDGLGKVIRARFKLFRRVKAITAEARWSGWFLSIFPLLAIVLINVMQPDYYSNPVMGLPDRSIRSNGTIFCNGRFWRFAYRAFSPGSAKTQARSNGPPGCFRDRYPWIRRRQRERYSPSLR